MSKQPEALRLATLWDVRSCGYKMTPEAKTAAELRRQSELIEEMREAIKEICNEAEVFGGGFAGWVQGKCIDALAKAEARQ